MYGGEMEHVSAPVFVTNWCVRVMCAQLHVCVCYFDTCGGKMEHESTHVLVTNSLLRPSRCLRMLVWVLLHVQAFTK